MPFLPEQLVASHPHEDKAILKGELSPALRSAVVPPRAVIIADPSLALCEVGLPPAVWKTLFVREVVNDLNRDYLNQCIRNGCCAEFPAVGAVALIFSDGKVRRLAARPPSSDAAQAYDLGTPGRSMDIPWEWRPSASAGGPFAPRPCVVMVDRQLRDGDLVLLNRTPSLQRSNLLGFRVRRLPEGAAIAINPDLCGAFDADFDGDEMNVFVVQASAA